MSGGPPLTAAARRVIRAMLPGGRYRLADLARCAVDGATLEDLARRGLASRAGAWQLTRKGIAARSRILAAEGGADG